MLILWRALLHAVITEAGALGAAILAGVGNGIFADVQTGVDVMVKLDCVFEPI